MYVAPRPFSDFAQRQLIQAIEAGQVEKVQQLLDKRPDDVVPAGLLRRALFQTPPVTAALLMKRTESREGQQLAVELLDEGHPQQAQPLVQHYGAPVVLTAAVRHQKTGVIDTLLAQGVIPEPEAINAARSPRNLPLIARLVDQVPDDAVGEFHEALYELPRVNDEDRVARIVAHLPPGQKSAHELYLASRTAADGGHLGLFDALVAQLPASKRPEAYTSALKAAVTGGHAAMVAHVLPKADVNTEEGSSLRTAITRNDTAILALLAPVADFNVARKSLVAHRKWDLVNALVPWAPAAVQEAWLSHPKLAPAQAALRAQSAHEHPPTAPARRQRFRA